MVAVNEIVMSFDFDVDFETARGLSQDVSDHVPCQRGLLPNH